MGSGKQSSSNRTRKTFQTEQDLKTRKNSLGELLKTQNPASVFETAENASRNIPEEFALGIKPPGSKFVTTNDLIDESIKTKNSGYANISDITNYKEDILLSDNKFKIRRLKRNGQFEELSPSITDDDLSFEGIHVTKKNEIILGFTNRRAYSAGFLELTHMIFSPPKMVSTYNKSIMRRVESNSKEFITLPKK
ncbi:unnamed protein product [Mytilus edulis]|uniref:Uncharacterized protein n=1 Tax=Mytilus edulis TaxID=6550 RepID=A0A8S3RC85_MYTED|nr:unnamed protein product [Mytilus edulis]